MKRNSGFTLIEAVMSVALFGIVMAILFTAIRDFQKGWLKEYAKQSVNAQFVRVFRAIDNDLSKSDSKLFMFYNEKDSDNTLKNRRWFYFPITEEESDILTGQALTGPNRDGTVRYNRLIVYYLRSPKNDHCIGDKTKTCPHKQLVRIKIAIKGLPGYTDLGTNETHAVAQYINSFRTDIGAITVNPKVNDLVGTKGTIIDVRTMESDIVDLTVRDFGNERVRFNLMLLRIMDAMKHFRVGETELITGADVTKPEATGKAKRYLEETSWITMTRNQ